MYLASHNVEDKINIDCMIDEQIQSITAQHPDFWTLKTRNHHSYAHSIFHYPAMMVPEIQRKIIEIILKNKPTINSVYDPYVGAGTTFTAALSCGLNCYGNDINPLAILISKVKTNLSWEESDLYDTLRIIKHHIENDDSTLIDISFPNIRKWFTDEIAIELSKIRRAITTLNNIALRRVFWVILAETIRTTCNDRTTTYKLHVRPIAEIEKRNISPITVFLHLALNSISDLISYKNQLYTYKEHDIKLHGTTKLFLGDSMDYNFVKEKYCELKFDLLVTSPPYGDNGSTITYGQHSYLPLQWIELTDIDEGIDFDLLRTTQEIDNRSLGGNSTKITSEIIDNLSQESTQIKKVFKLFALSNQPIDRMNRVARFYHDFALSIDNIQKQMAFNSYQVWTVGNRRVGGFEIPNDQILIELLSTRNVLLVSEITRNIYNKRMPHKNKISQTMKQEKILIFRKK